VKYFCNARNTILYI
jgi:hypothetical protein